MDAETEIIMTIAAAIVSILALSVVPAMPIAIQNGKTAPSVAGTWALAIKGPAGHAPHGDVPASLVLEQKEVKVTGSFSAHGSEHPVAGEFTDGTLTLETTGSESNRHLTLTAKLKSDGTLAGYLSGPMGDMQWTASQGQGQEMPVWLGTRFAICGTPAARSRGCRWPRRSSCCRSRSGSA